MPPVGCTTVIWQCQARRAQKQLCLWADLSSRQKLVTELGGFLLSVWHLALAEAFGLLRGTASVVRHPLIAPVIPGPGDCVRRSHEGGAKPPLQAPGERPTRAVGA
jgi:hypothetical protein